MITWTPSTEEKFDEMLGVLPPAAMAKGAFLVGEPLRHKGGRPAFEAHKHKDGVYSVSDDAVTFAEFKAEFPDAERY